MSLFPLISITNNTKPKIACIGQTPSRGASKVGIVTGEYCSVQKLVEIIKSRDPGLSEADIFRALCCDVYHFLNADLISIWSIEDDGDSIVRRFLFEDGQEREQDPGKEVRLSRTEHPDYFVEILSSICLLAPDVRDNPNLESLVETYFNPQGVQSLLDYVIYRNMIPVGIICCEARDARSWLMSDAEKIRSLTVAMSFEFEAQIFPLK